MTPTRVPLARDFALLSTEVATLRRKNEDLKRQLKLAETFIPVQSLDSYDAAVNGDETKGGW